MSEPADQKNKPWETRNRPRFAGPATFHRLPASKEFKPDSIVCIGAPLDAGTTYRPGARFGPRALREATTMVREYVPELDLCAFETRGGVDFGDVNINPLELIPSLTLIEAEVDSVIRQGGIPAVVGGDHSITLANLRAVCRNHGPVTLIHFDAHMDLSEQSWGTATHHGTWLRLAIEEGLVRHVFQFGIRGPYGSRQEATTINWYPVTCFTADDIHSGVQPAGFHESGGPYYITFDVDCIDPAYAPGTGTPVPGGLTGPQALQIICSLKGISPIVGYDMVELLPAFDHSGNTALLLAQIGIYLAALTEVRSIK